MKTVDAKVSEDTNFNRGILYKILQNSSPVAWISRVDLNIYLNNIVG